MYLKVRVPEEMRLNNDIYNLMPQASTNVSVETILVLNCIGDIGVTWRMCVSKKHLTLETYASVVIVPTCGVFSLCSEYIFHLKITRIVHSKLIFS